MKNKFYLILVTLLFILSACEERYEEDKKNIIEYQKPEQKEIIQATVDEVSSLVQIITTPPPKKIPTKEYHYEFKNLKGQVNTLDITNDIYNFKNIKQSIIILNIMSTWCPPCRGQIPHLSKLQQKFKENVFVMSTLVYDDISTKELKKFNIAEKILFYVSITQDENLKFIDMLTPKLGLSKDFPLPLTIVFVRGKYFTHYEGMIPEEMIESDIKQLLEKIKK
jgi:thiol-disulfide isomerase/thioredoxin